MIEAVSGCPDAAGKAFVALLFDHGPRRTVGFDATTESGVTGGKEIPVGGHSQDGAGGVEHVARFGEGANFFGVSGGQDWSETAGKEARWGSIYMV